MKKLLVTFLIILGTTLAFGATTTEATPELKVGDKFPILKLTTMDGKKISTDSFKGKKLLIGFSATWCPYCINDKKLFNPVYESTLKDNKEIETIIIFGDYGKKTVDTKDKVKDYMKTNNYSFPVYYDAKKAIINSIGVKGIPTTFLVDVDGTILEKDEEFYKLQTFSAYAPQK